MNPEALALITACRDAANAALTLAAAVIEARDDPDDWHRMPTGKNRCPVSGWSRSTIYRVMRAGHIRGKTVKGARYYSTTDARAEVTCQNKGSR